MQNELLVSNKYYLRYSTSKLLIDGLLNALRLSVQGIV